VDTPATLSFSASEKTGRRKGEEDGPSPGAHPGGNGVRPSASRLLVPGRFGGRAGAVPFGLPRFARGAVEGSKRAATGRPSRFPSRTREASVRFSLPASRRCTYRRLTSARSAKAAWVSPSARRGSYRRVIVTPQEVPQGHSCALKRYRMQSPQLHTKTCPFCEEAIQAAAISRGHRNSWDAGLEGLGGEGSRVPREHLEPGNVSPIVKYR